MRNKMLIAILAIIFATACNKKTHRPVETHHTHISGTSYTDVPVEQVQLENNLGDRVYFAFNKSDIEPQYEELLERQAEWMKANPDIRILIEGHADDRGEAEYNVALGNRRAFAVKKVLISKGVQKEHIDVVSYGKDKPAVEGTGEAVWSQNRRAVIGAK